MLGDAIGNIDDAGISNGIGIIVEEDDRGSLTTKKNVLGTNSGGAITTHFEPDVINGEHLDRAKERPIEAIDY